MKLLIVTGIQINYMQTIIYIMNYHSLLFIRFIELLYYIWDDITQEGKIKLNKTIKPYLDFDDSFEALL